MTGSASAISGSARLAITISRILFQLLSSGYQILTMASVRFKNLTKVYPGSGKQPDVTAVKGIHLEIQDHEFMVLVGPSGSGKSTTLRMLAGLETITDGACSIGDRVVNGLLPKDRDIAMVFQNYVLYPHLTVFDNMAFGLRIQKQSKEEIQVRVHEAADILGLTELLNRKPTALSGGQRQRVAVGRAIVRKPQVFLFDEPLSNLDAKMRVQMRTEIAKLHSRLDTTMIYVTHDQVEAMTLGDRICVMNEGRIMQVDTPLQLYNYPQNLFVAGFIGSPAMNLFQGRLAREGNTLRFKEASGGFTLNLPTRMDAKLRDFAGKELVLGLRPEHVSVESDALPPAFKATVDVIEPMGSETFLYLTTGQADLVAKVPPSHPIKTGDTVGIHFNRDRIHCFNPATEALIQGPAL